MENTNEIRNMIGGTHFINEEKWSLSLVRKLGQDHAYLILEGIENGSHVCIQAHLVIKDNTDNKKANIIYDSIGCDKLKQLCQGCNSYTWQITKEQGQALIKMIKDEKAKSDRNEINYVLTGKTKLNTFFNASLTNDSNASVENKSRNVSVDALVVKGHSCCSWSIAMIETLKLPAPKSFSPVFVCVPKHIIKGSYNADRLEPETTARCSIM